MDRLLRTASRKRRGLNATKFAFDLDVKLLDHIVLPARSSTSDEPENASHDRVLVVVWKRGGRMASTRGVPVTNSQAVFNERLSLLSTLYQDPKTQQYQEKKCTISVKEQLSDTRFRTVAQTVLDLRQYANHRKEPQILELSLNTGSDRTNISAKMEITAQPLAMDDDLSSIVSDVSALSFTDVPSEDESIGEISGRLPSSAHFSQAELGALRHRMYELERKLESVSSERDSLQNRLSAVLTSPTKASADPALDPERMQAEIAALKAQLRERDKELNDIHETHREEIAATREQLDTLQKEYKVLLKKREQSSTATMALSPASRQVLGIGADEPARDTALQERVQSLTLELEEMKEERDKYRAKSEAMRRAMDQMEKDGQSLRRRLEDLRDEIALHPYSPLEDRLSSLKTPSKTPTRESMQSLASHVVSDMEREIRALESELANTKVLHAQASFDLEMERTKSRDLRKQLSEESSKAQRIAKRMTKFEVDVYKNRK